MLGVVSFVDNDPGISDIVWGPFNVSAMPFLGGGFAGHIFADNFELPITLRWDSTLINNDVVLSAFSEGMNSSIMDNAYLFNYDESGAFCISLHPGELVLPPFDWFSQEHFPIYIEISNGNFCFSLSVEDFNLKDINVYPNPASTLIRVDMEGPIQSLQIMNLQGQTILTHSAEAMGALNEIDISSLPTGMYLLMVSNSKGQGMAKFVKD
jgi:hypothetical protein